MTFVLVDLVIRPTSCKLMVRSPRMRNRRRHRAHDSRIDH